MTTDNKQIKKATTGLRVITDILFQHIQDVSAGIFDSFLRQGNVCLIITLIFASSILVGCSLAPIEPAMRVETQSTPTASARLFNSPIAQAAQAQTQTGRRTSATPAVLQSKKISSVIATPSRSPTAHAPLQPKKTSPVIAARVNQSIKNGSPVTEIDNPTLTFPAGIYVDQIDKYFKIDNILLALVYRPSDNLFGFPLTPEPTVCTPLSYFRALIV